jgi:hypothetical protein
VPLPKPVQEFESVHTWFRGLRDQWGEDPDDWQERLDALAAFCAFADKAPDTMIRECVRESEAGKRIRAKGRQFYNDKIAEWQASLPGDKPRQARAGNAVRSFLIHNGIFLQSGLQT